MNLIIKDSTSDSHGLKLYHYFDGKEWSEKWEVNEEASKMVMTNHFKKLEPIRNQVLAGQLSPLVYHLESQFFDISLLSSYTGISKRHIKKHLKPENFNQLDEEILKKYAAAFGISIEELLKI